LEEKNGWGKRLVRTVLLAVIGWKVLTRMQEQGVTLINNAYLKLSFIACGPSGLTFKSTFHIFNSPSSKFFKKSEGVRKLIE